MRKNEPTNRTYIISGQWVCARNKSCGAQASKLVSSSSGTVHLLLTTVVQYLLLTGLYLQGTQRSVEAWTVHGLAVKAAFQLGLHSTAASSRFPPLDQEFRKRVWYGCVVLDRTLSMTFGRPAAIPDDYVRMQLPQSLGRAGLGVSHDLIKNDTQEASVAFFNATM